MKKNAHIFTEEERKTANNNRTKNNIIRFHKGEISKQCTLKKYFLLENDYVCSKCGIGDDWNGEKLVLELDHISGDPSDNVPENLRLLCPNCHSQTSTFRAKNIGTGNRSYMKKYYGYREK